MDSSARLYSLHAEASGLVLTLSKPITDHYQWTHHVVFFVFSMWQCHTYSFAVPNVSA